MTQDELLLDVIRRLNKLGVIYMLTGAYAVSFHGEPRATHDIDIKINLQTKDITSIYENFKRDFYIGKDMVEDAVKEQRMFNIIHLDTGIKVDFWISKDANFDRLRMERRTKDSFLGEPVYVASPEDTILVKLEWFKNSESEKHWRDALSILKVSKKNLDYNYIEKWAKELGILDVWKKIKKTEDPERKSSTF